MARGASATDVPLHADLVVEGFFSKLTRQSLKRGVFRSVDDLEQAITRYIAATNKSPKPFVFSDMISFPLYHFRFDAYAGSTEVVGIFTSWLSSRLAA